MISLCCPAPFESLLNATLSSNLHCELSDSVHGENIKMLHVEQVNSHDHLHIYQVPTVKTFLKEILTAVTVLTLAATQFVLIIPEMFSAELCRFSEINH